MAKSSSNALWIGAIVIVAALTAVELMSTSSEEDAVESAENALIADGAASVATQQQDAGQIAMGATETMDNEPLLSDMAESEGGFIMEPEPTDDLILDLDNPEADIAPIGDALLDEIGDDVTEAGDTINAVEETLARVEIDGVTPVEPIESDITDVQSAVSEIDETEPEHSESIADSTPAAHSVAEHLAAAEKAIAALRLTTPEDDNAYAHYQAVLALEPDNAAAHAGIQQMVTMYVYFIEKAIADGERNTARVYLGRAEMLQPNAEKLKSLRAELD